MMTAWHRYADGGVRWRADSLGIEVEGQGFQRTPGPIVTIAKLWDQWADPIQHWAHIFNVPVELLLMTAATESRRDLDPRQDLKEPGYVSDESTPHRVSIGLCHVLISTARGALGFAVGRQWLAVPRNNFMAAALVLRDDARTTGFDPILAAAKYNAGALRPSSENRFGLRVTGDHLDRAARWFGDAVTFIAAHGGAERDWQWALKASASRVLV